MRSWLGPVFLYECLIGSRRWQIYAVRSLGVSLLLAAMATIAWSNNAFSAGRSIQEYAQLGRAYLNALIGVELAIVMLVAPAATAGAICLDRSRGTLAHLLATDLSDTEIVLGKLAARILPVLGLVGCTWPVLAMSTLLGGVDPWALLIGFAVIVAALLLGSSLALLLSVWARKPHEVILATYTFWMLLTLLPAVWTEMARSGLVIRPPRWVDLGNPFYAALAPSEDLSAIHFWDYFCFFGATLGAAALFAVVAIWRMRPVARRAGGTPGVGLGRLGRLSRWLPGPSLDGNPVLWREWHRSRPSFWMVGLFLLVGGSTSIACGIGAIAAWRRGFMGLAIPSPPVAAGVVGAMIQVFFGLLMLAALAPMSMSEEQERGSLEVLAATPLSTRAIVLGKWWGIFRMVPWLTIGPGLLALALATAKLPVPPPFAPGARGLFFPPMMLSLPYRLFGVALMVAMILAHGAATTSVGLALAVWFRRQSRAVAVSIGLFVLVSIGWPLLVLIVAGRGRGNDDAGLAGCSPIFYTFYSCALLANRHEQLRIFFWWAAVWVFEAALLAAVVAWLTIRTFDRCFGRMPEERPQPSRTLPWVVVLAIAGAAAVLGNWGFDIVLALNQDYDETTRIFGFGLVAMVELVVVSLVAAVMASFQRSERAQVQSVPIDV